MYQDKIVLCGANSYEEKFYMNPDFDNLPQHIKDELKIMCVLYVHDVGGILTLVFEENGELEFEVTSAEGDPMFDEIGSRLKINEIQTDEKMAGVTDLPFRLLCKEQGAGLLCMEMISAKALQYKNKNTKALLAIDPREYPVSLQLFGEDPDIISEQAKRIEELPFQILDINMGCPVPKVVRNGEGSALMKDPKRIYDIVYKTAKAIKKPVTIKIRQGPDDTWINAPEIAKVAEEAGAAAIAVHGRTREQYYSGNADWEIIRKVKEAVKIPVIGNGDVTSGQKALDMFEQTGCDGVMIGRGCQGNPWIFRELLAYEETGSIPERPGTDQIRETMLRHARLQIEFKGDYIGIREMRKHVAWYTKGMQGSAKLSDEINQVESYEELENLLMEKIG